MSEEQHWAAWCLEGGKLHTIMAAKSRAQARGFAVGMRQSATKSSVVQTGFVKLIPEVKRGKKA